VKRIINLLFILFILMSCGKHDGSKNIDNPSQKSSSLKWEEADFPIHFYIPQNYSDKMKENISKAGKAWEESYCDIRGEYPISRCWGLFFRFIELPEGEFIDSPDKIYDSLYDYTEVIFKRTQNWYEDRSNTELATTTLLFTDTNWLLTVDVFFNFAEHFFGDGEQYPFVFDFESIMIHELGHVLGFNHTENEYSVMQAKIAPGQIRRTVYSLDGLSCINKNPFYDEDVKCGFNKSYCTDTCKGEWIPSADGEKLQLKYPNITIP